MVWLNHEVVWDRVCIGSKISRSLDEGQVVGPVLCLDFDRYVVDHRLCWPNVAKWPAGFGKTNLRLMVGSKTQQVHERVNPQMPIIKIQCIRYRVFFSISLLILLRYSYNSCIL